MQINFMHTDVTIRPGSVAELLASVDGRTLRVTIDWQTLGRLLGAAIADEGMVRAFIRERRDAIEVATRARLYAQGVPPDRRLSLHYEDLINAMPGSRAGAG
jgi:hypothetical protein